MSSNPLDLLRNALGKVQDKALLAEVQKRSAEIRRVLEETDLQFTEDEIRQMEEFPHWTAAVFQALAGPAPETGDDSALIGAPQFSKAQEPA